VATNFSRNLIRSVQRGGVATTTLPAGSPPTGVFSESEGPADGQAVTIDAVMQPKSSDDAFAELFNGGAAAEAAADSGDLAQILGIDADGAAKAFPLPLDAEPITMNQQNDIPEKDAVLAAAVEQTQAQPPVRASGGYASRFRGAGAAAAAPASAPAERPIEAARRAVPPVKPAASPEPEAVRPWRRFVDQKQTTEAVSARRGMAAAKVLTPLVAAVSFAPGNQSPSASKAKALTEMLVGVHRCARDTAETISTQTGQDVPSWLVTQLMQGLSTAIATRWQRNEGADIEALAENMRQVFAGDSKELIELISGASEDAYQEVNHPDIARYRISVSTANAAWVIHDWVTHERLSLDDKGDMPSRFFTYGLETHEIVSLMLTKTVDLCRGLVAQVESADMRTSHMQSSIARMANLIGSEYVTRTRSVMNWIAHPDISDEEYAARHAAAARDLEIRILPDIYEMARTNFVRIEQGAFRAIEDLYEKSKTSDSGGDGHSRPASA
jgi:hypothetical protein